LTYTATALTYGNTYKFKVEALNSYDYSEYSDIISILCAAGPEQPASPTSEIIND
jgi:hypothetical protein